jgi:Sec-independent protein translocase protein TatA
MCYSYGMSIGLTEWIVITLVFLLLFGRNLASLGAKLGRFTANLKGQGGGQPQELGQSVRKAAELYMKARKLWRGARSPFSL